MEIEEFTNKVKLISEGRGAVWVTCGVNITEESQETVRMLFAELIKCQLCGRCCSGFWFNVVPLFQADYERLLLLGYSVDDIKGMTKISDKDSVVCLTEPCKLMKDNRCLIHKDKPKACRDFPVQVGSKITINVSCPAGLELYLRLAKNNNFALDDVGL
jgi:Fe-S-cluster containining protein